MLKRTLHVFFLSTLLLSIFPGRSHSFGGDEHMSISNHAFRASLNYAQKKKWITDGDKKLLETCLCVNSDMNFGSLSRKVDNMKDPMEYIRMYESNNNECQTIDCHKAREALNTDKIFSKDKLIAFRENDDHFQERTLTKFREFNELAQANAARGNLVFALVLSAYASHYLEDFFAPGHVLTPRKEVNNISSWALHDYYSEEGCEITFKENSMKDGGIIAEIQEVIDTENNENGHGPGNGFCEIDKKKNQKWKMKIHGDDKLEETIGQREFITYEVARSIAAVFEARNKKRMCKPFDAAYSRKVDKNQEGDFYETLAASFDGVAYESKKRLHMLEDTTVVFESSPYLATPCRQGVDPRWGLEEDIAIFYIPRPGKKRWISKKNH